MWNGVDLIVDGGYRQKDTQSGFFGATPFLSFTSTYNDAVLQTWSITPRLSVKNSIFGIPSQILTGIDYYDATFHQERGAFQGLPPGPHLRSDATVVGRLLAAHGRAVADDRFLLWRAGSKHQPECHGIGSTPSRPIAPCFSIAALRQLRWIATKHNTRCTSVFEHRINDVFSVFGRAARAFRTPDVDERVSTGPAFGPPPFFDPLPQ